MIHKLFRRAVLRHTRSIQYGPWSERLEWNLQKTTKCIWPFRCCVCEFVWYYICLLDAKYHRLGGKFYGSYKDMKYNIIISRLEIHIRLINHAKIGPSPGSDTLYAVQPYCPGTEGNCPSECDSDWWIAQTVSIKDTTMKVECIGNCKQINWKYMVNLF